jgi:hypothetical protein
VEGYVLAVACSAEVTTKAGKFRADTLAAKIPKRAWQKMSGGAGAKGNRFYDWAVIDLAEPGPGHRQLLIRRNRRTGELAYYRCHCTSRVPLATWVKVAGSQWRVEETLCATRRSAVSPGSAGRNWREVPGFDGLPDAERLIGTRACQETSDRAQTPGAVRWGTRATW